MKARITLDDIRRSACAHLNKHLFPEKPQDSTTKPQKKSKYGNQKTTVGDIQFDSNKEANYYRYLLIQQKIGKIGFLQRQVEYELNEGGAFSFKYISDFEYLDMVTGKKVVVDVKGFRTREYKKKKRLMKKIHGITIKEI